MFTIDQLNYLRMYLEIRIDHARAQDDLGASAIEWAIISAIVAALALGIGTVIYQKVTGTANKINTDFKPTG